MAIRARSSSAGKTREDPRPSDPVLPSLQSDPPRGISVQRSTLKSAPPIHAEVRNIFRKIANTAGGTSLDPTFCLIPSTVQRAAPLFMKSKYGRNGGCGWQSSRRAAPGALLGVPLHSN